MNNNNCLHPEKYQMLNEDQRFINLILDRTGHEIKWLAEKMNMEYEVVRYQLREAINYRQDFHQRCISILKKEGLISSNREVCEKLKDDLIDFSSVLSGTISILTKSVKEKINDRILSEEEKKILKDEIRNNLRRVTDEFNDLLITIDLK